MTIFCETLYRGLHVERPEDSCKITKFLAKASRAVGMTRRTVCVVLAAVIVTIMSIGTNLTGLLDEFTALLLGIRRF
jgi:hypothetical protein